MIDIHAEELLTFDDTRRLPVFIRRGRPSHISSVYRAATAGLLSSTGERVVLETVKTPKGRVTTRDAVARFCAELSGHSAAAARESKPSASRESLVSERAATAVLDAAGI